MTSFYQLSKSMFKEKRKYVYLVLIVQVIAVIIFAILNFTNYKSAYFSPYLNTSVLSIRSALFDNVVNTSLFADIIFCGLMCWQNERENLSQTWREAPLSDTKFYFANIFSSIVGCIYIFLIQIVLGFLTLFPSMNLMSTAANNLLGMTQYSPPFIDRLLAMALFLFLIVTTIFVFVSFTNFLARTIVDFLPVKNTFWVRLLTMAILVIIASYIFIQISTRFQNYVDNRFAAKSVSMIALSADMSLNATMLEFILIILVLGGINLVLFNKFIEAKIDK